MLQTFILLQRKSTLMDGMFRTHAINDGIVRSPKRGIGNKIKFTREDQQSWSNLIDLRRVDSMS